MRNRRTASPGPARTAGTLLAGLSSLGAAGTRAGHIHAVNMTQQTSLMSKRVGYLASAVCLTPDNQLTTLMVNTMRRDVVSSNHVEVCAALIAIPKLINVEMLPALLEPVTARPRTRCTPTPCNFH